MTVLSDILRRPSSPGPGGQESFGGVPFHPAGSRSFYGRATDAYRTSIDSRVFVCFRHYSTEALFVNKKCRNLLLFHPEKGNRQTRQPEKSVAGNRDRLVGVPGIDDDPLFAGEVQSELGTLGSGVHQQHSGLFSVGAYAIPLLLVIHGIFYAEDITKKRLISRIIFSVIGFIIFFPHLFSTIISTWHPRIFFFIFQSICL